MAEIGLEVTATDRVDANGSVRVLILQEATVASFNSILRHAEVLYPGYTAA
jgi:hypothetical protein